MPQAMRSRVTWVDLAKGICAILVIMVHTIRFDRPIRGAVTTFFIILFFLLSCYTFRFSTDRQSFVTNVKKGARHILIPAVITYAVKVLLEAIADPTLFVSSAFWKMRLYTLLFASGDDTLFVGVTIQKLGPLWFFFAVFTGRTIFDWIHQNYRSEQLPVICGLCSLIGFAVGKLQPLPFSMDIALTVMPVFYAGYLLRSAHPEQNAVKKLILWGIVWIVSYWLLFPDPGNDQSFMDVAIRRFPFYPVCLIAGYSGTMAVCEGCILLSRIRAIWNPVLFFGRNSLYVLCVHYLDEMWKRFWYVENQDLYSFILRTAIDLTLTAALVGLLSVPKLLKNKQRIEA